MLKTAFSANLFELVGDAAMNAVASRMRRRAARRTSSFSKIVAPIDDLIGVRLFSTGSFERTQLDGIRQHIAERRYPANGTFIDIGANIGVYSMALAGHFDRQYAFEANPVTHKILEANMAIVGNTKTECLNVALSDKSASTFVYVPENGNLGWATLEPEHHVVPVSPVAIQCETLDDACRRLGTDVERISLIKIDVEGHELPVVRGAADTIRQARPDLLCEVLSNEYGKPLFELLLDYGYRGFHVFERKFDPRRPWLLPVRKRRIDPKNPGHEALVLATFG